MREVIVGCELINKVLLLCGLPALDEGVGYAKLSIDSKGEMIVHTEGLALKPVPAKESE